MLSSKTKTAKETERHIVLAIISESSLRRAWKREIGICQPNIQGHAGKLEREPNLPTHKLLLRESKLHPIYDGIIRKLTNVSNTGTRLVSANSHLLNLPGQPHPPT